MTLQRRHFEFIAETLRSFTGSDRAHADMVSHFAKCLEGCNPRFDTARFINACQRSAS